MTSRFAPLLALVFVLVLLTGGLVRAMDPADKPPSISQKIVSLITSDSFNDIILTILVTLASLGLAFRFVLPKWVENSFQKQIESFKHENKVEIEDLKLKINTLSNRITKSYEKEFEILSELWEKLQNTLGITLSFTSPLQKSPDFDKMSPEQLNSYLEKSELQDFQKTELLNSSDKVEYYNDIMFWYNLQNSQEHSNEFHNYLLRHKIFVQPDLFNKLQELDTILRESLTMKQIAEESADRKMGDDAYKKIRDDAQPLRDLIGKLIQKRLHITEND